MAINTKAVIYLYINDTKITRIYLKFKNISNNRNGS